MFPDHITIDSIGRALVFVFTSLTATTSFYISVPMLINLYRWGRHGELNFVRIAAPIYSIGNFMISTWASIVWFDAAFLHHTILSNNIDNRWPIDLLVWIFPALGSTAYFIAFRDRLRRSVMETKHGHRSNTAN